MIFQEPMTSLDPLYTIGNQLIEPIMHHQQIGRRCARARAVEMLKLVRIPEPERRMRSYPHELSGGQRQRVMIAMAIANDPDILIADEPTTALDVTIQAEILDLMADLQQRLGMGLIFITHDLNIVRRIADRVYVMRYGEVVEEGEAKRFSQAPKHPYTKALLAAEPTGRKGRPSPSARQHARRHRCARDRSNWRRVSGRRADHAQGRRSRFGHAEARPDHRHCRRIRLGKVDTRPRAAAAPAERRRHPFDGRDIAKLIATRCVHCASRCRSCCRIPSAR